MRGLDWPRTQQSQAPCTTSSACPVVDQGGAGTCTGKIQFTTYAGQNGTIPLPDEIACTRPGYRLYQLTYTEDGQKRNGERWEPCYPDETVPIGTDSFTLFAQWQPLGVEIT